MQTTSTAIVGANIRAEMARAGHSQTALAAELEMSQSGISKRLRGVIAFDVDEVVAVANWLGVSVTDLLAGVESVSAA